MRSLRCWCQEAGAAAPEYAIVLSFIAGAVGLTASHFNLNDVFALVASKVAALLN